MSFIQNTKLTVLVAAIGVALAVKAEAQGAPKLRKHTETQSQSLSLAKANRKVNGAKVSIVEKGQTRVITGNGIPNHKVGKFPNNGNPHRIKAQSYRFSVPIAPKKGTARELGLGDLFGVGVNGVPFDPGAAEFWQGNRRSGWQYEALGGAVPLGLDANYAHVQPTGAYHYHGLPVGLMQSLGWSRSSESPLIGYAADGFPIYAITATVGGKVREMTSSYRLKSGNRSGGSAPGGKHDGTFVQDYAYVKGSGSLDECNGAFVKTKDYPQGTYAYFLTSSYPVIPRCHKAQAQSSFGKRR